MCNLSQSTAKLKPTDSANRWHRQESWRALEELQRAGKIRTIGVSNYLVRHLEEMKEYATIPPAINQCEFHPLLFNKGLLGYCNKNGILLEAYSSLGEGHLVNGDEDLPELDEISHRHQIPPVQILLKWALQHGVAVIPKASSAEHLLENFEATRFELSPEEMAKLDSISERKQKRFCWDSSKII
ncbi:hypothetical protein EV182_005042 [Spiromyces aspiralis]|uniref:Uncharacterized protein n=1 Tax=Spiromyces aspiralis TaxID=68401 RepID=A0ACC1HNF3_9FUNG|nr:hypothetical protein EV182_005042 [Spiromyces aspiralis]